jgi:hypothetical protein
MLVEQVLPTTFRLTLEALELTALVTAARWAAAGAQGHLTPSTLEQLKRLLASYDEQWRHLERRPSPV